MHRGFRGSNSHLSDPEFVACCRGPLYQTTNVIYISDIIVLLLEPVRSTTTTAPSRLQIPQVRQKRKPLIKARPYAKGQCSFSGTS